LGNSEIEKPMQKISIRAMEPEEWLAVRQMRLEALRSSPGLYALPYDEVATWTAEYWQAEIKGDDHRIFGLFDRKELIGITAAFTWRGDKTGKTALLAMSYIAPEYRGRGLSRKLYEARLNWILEQPQFTKAIVGHRASNEISMRANQRHGFVPTARIATVWPDGTAEDEIVYERVLERKTSMKPR
jgi:RimJ/RimL family protein N-acetyltransferase